jgi:hypothetical protein
MERAALFLGVLAYPEAGAGDPDNGAGARFTDALRHYAVWTARRQYGLRQVRSIGLDPAARESWEGTLFNGGARIKRRLAALRAWSFVRPWVVGDPSPDDAAELGSLPVNSIRSVIRHDLERWHRALRLDGFRGAPSDEEGVVRQLRSYINESKAVLHMAAELRDAMKLVATLPHHADLPYGERTSWRRAWLNADKWIDGAIARAEQFRTSQEPHHQNGLVAGEMVALVWKTPPKFTP